MRPLLVVVAAALLASSCSEPQVLLNEAPFPFSSAAAIPFESETELGLHKGTVVLLSNAPSTCAAFKDERNVCNARAFPDLRFVVWPFATPISAYGASMFVMLNDTVPGKVSLLHRTEDPTPYGVTVVTADRNRVRTTEHEAWLERINPGQEVEVSFNGTLSDGHRVRGNVAAEWCDGMLIGTDNELASKLNAGGSLSAQYQGTTLKGMKATYQCGDASIVTTCTIAPDADTAECSCTDGTHTRTFTQGRAATADLTDACPLRFGDE